MPTQCLAKGRVGEWWQEGVGKGRWWWGKGPLIFHLVFLTDARDLCCGAGSQCGELRTWQHSFWDSRNLIQQNFSRTETGFVRVTARASSR